MNQVDKFGELTSIVRNRFPIDNQILYTQQQIINKIQLVFDEYDWFHQAIIQTSGLDVDLWDVNHNGMNTLLQHDTFLEKSVFEQIHGLCATRKNLSTNEKHLLMSNSITYFYIINLLCNWISIENKINTNQGRTQIDDILYHIQIIIEDLQMSDYYENVRYLIKHLVLFCHISKNGFISFDNLSQYGASPRQIRPIIYDFNGLEDIDLCTNTEIFLKIHSNEKQKAKLGEVIYKYIIDYSIELLKNVNNQSELSVWNIHILYLQNEISFFLNKRASLGFITMSSRDLLLEKILILDMRIKEQYYSISI